MAKRRTTTLLRRIRLSLKMSRYAASKATGIPYSTLLYIESGKTTRLNLEHLAALGKLYGRDFTVAELLA
jgi:transcriptional regulator with XRE-family HTH domain